MRSRGSDRLADAKLAREPAYAAGGIGAGGSDGVIRNAGTWLRELTRERTALLWLLPLSLAAIYLIVFLVQLPHNVTAVTWDSDYSSGFTVPEAVVHSGTGGHTLLASSAQWVPLLFGLLTATLPLHRELWSVAPTLLFVASALIVGWSVSQLAGRRAGALAALLGLVASAPALTFFMAAVAHNTVYPLTALLGAYLIWLTRGAGRRQLVAVTVPPLLGIVVGMCLASDTLVAPTALVPLALTAILAGVRRDRHARLLALSALTTAVVALPAAKATSAIMRSFGFVTIAQPASLVPLSQLSAQARTLWRGLEVLFNGYLRERPGTLHTPLGITSDVVMSAALLTLIVVGATTTFRFLSSGLRKHSAETPAELARSLHIIYWAASAAAACGAFWIYAETGNGTNAHESYYATVLFSVAAVVPLLLSRGTPARWLIAIGTSLFFAASLAGLTSNYMNIAEWIERSKPEVLKIAQANHVTVGYGGYGEASSLTWNTDGHLKVRPLMECENPEGAGICPFYIERVPAWYVPQNRHTFLLVDSEEAWVKSLPSGLGKPLAQYAFGSMHMYIYPYDIASRLGPNPD
jgi:hypothetical protein